MGLDAGCGCIPPQVLAFTGGHQSVADPEDRGMLDIPGLDPGVPEVVRQFVLGEL